MRCDEDKLIGKNGGVFYTYGRTFDGEESALSLEDFYRDGESRSFASILVSPSGLKETVIYFDENGDNKTKVFRRDEYNDGGETALDFVKSLV